MSGGREALAELAPLSVRFERTAGVTTTQTGGVLTVYLDDAKPEDAHGLLARYVKGERADLAYIGGGIVRASWHVLIGDVHVTFTDIDDLNEWMHRVNDIRELTDAELAEYAYDDTGADDCEVSA